MPNQSAQARTRRRPLIAATIFAVVVTAVVSAILATNATPAAVAQGGRTVTGLTATSATPGQIDVTWNDVTDAKDYRVAWTKQGEYYKTWTDDTGNHFPSDSLQIITGLTEGETYKVKVRARFHDNNPGPWTEQTNITVASSPMPTPTPTLEPDPVSEEQQEEDGFSSEDDDFTDNTNTTAVLGREADKFTIIGATEVGSDKDWIRLQNNINRSYWVVVSPYSDDDHTAATSPTISRVMASDGTTVHDASPQHGKNGGWDAARGTDYYLEITAAGAGSYTVTAHLTDESEHYPGGAQRDLPASASTQGYIAPYFDIKPFAYGSLTPGDVDWYQTQLTGGTSYSIGTHVNARASNTDKLPAFILLDSSGNPVPGGPSGEGPRVMVPCASGTNTYYLAVQEDGDIQSGRYNYKISVWHHSPISNPMSGSVVNDGQIELSWQCFAAADSHRIEIFQNGTWNTLGTYDVGVHSAKIGGITVQDDAYRIRIVAVLDGNDGDTREITLVRKPAAPGSLRGSWRVQDWDIDTKVRWDAVEGANRGYDAEIYDHSLSQWVSINPSSLAQPGITVSFSRDNNRLSMSHISPRYIQRGDQSGRDQIRIRVRAVSAAASSDWATKTILHPSPYASAATNLRLIYNATNMVTIYHTFPAFEERTCVKRYQNLGYQVMYQQDGDWYVIDNRRNDMPALLTGATRSILSLIPQHITERTFKVRQYGRGYCQGDTYGYISEWSEAVTIQNELDAPVKLSGEVTGERTVTLSWDPVEGADFYWMRVWQSSDWSDIGGWRGTTKVADNLPTNPYWYIFQVRARTQVEQTSEWSKPLAVFNTRR